jgi:hypothetical protein
MGSGQRGALPREGGRGPRGLAGETVCFLIFRPFLFEFGNGLFPLGKKYYNLSANYWDLFGK